MKYPVSLLACGLLIVSVNSLAIPLDPLAVGYNIDARGARSVVSELAGADQLTAVENSIRLGDDNWIALAPKLIDGGNPQFTSGIKAALSSALLYNPAAVLGTVDHAHSLSVEEVCSTPKNGGADFQQRALHTLSTIRNADLFALRDACTSALQK